MAPPVLWHFRFSHYGEKVRWALDWKGVPHVRRAVAPGPHAPEMLELSGQRAVPVLEWDGRVITDSTAIIAALETAVPVPALYPADPTERARALDLEEYFDEELGPHVRRAVFHALLPDADFCIALFSDGLDAGVRSFYDTAFPAIRRVMQAEMGIDDAGAAASRTAIHAALDRIAAERGDRQHLVGGAFTIADLTAAALLSPLLRPPELPYQLERARPAAFVALCDGIASHPSFAWGRETYRRHRGTSAEIA